MPQLAYISWFDDAVAAFLFLGVPFAMGVTFGIAALGIAWGGRRAGMVFGGLALVGSMLGLAGLLLTAPYLWWITVIPIAIGVVTVRAWYRHNGTATARRPRFDLRGLFILILLFGLILGGVASQHRQTVVEEEMIKQLEALSGGRSNQFSGPFGRVTEALFFSPLSPADFDLAADALERLSQLHQLQINAILPGRVTQRIGRLTTLRSLCAQNLQVTDDDLAPLANLKDLENLELDASRLTDAGLVHLGGLERLRVLNLINANQITPAAMTKLRAGLPRLDNR